MYISLYNLSLKKRCDHITDDELIECIWIAANERLLLTFLILVEYFSSSLFFLQSYSHVYDLSWSVNVLKPNQILKTKE